MTTTLPALPETSRERQERFQEIAADLSPEQAVEAVQVLLGDSEMAPRQLNALLADEDGAWRRDKLLLPPNVASLAKLCADENPRYAMTGVKVMATRKGYRMEATDGKVLGVLTGPQTRGEEADFPDLPGHTAIGGTALEAVIPAKALVGAAKMPPAKDSRPVLRNVVLSLGKHMSCFGATDLEVAHNLSTRHVEGRFPPVREVIPTKPPLASANFDPKLLIKLLSVAAEFCPTDSNRVTFELHGDKPAVVRVHNPYTGQEFTGVIMPLS